MKIGIKQAVKDIARAIKVGLVIMLQGDPGIGKSAIIWGIAKLYNLKVIDVRLAQCDPTDLNGFPMTVEVPYENPDYIEGGGEPEYLIKKIATYIPMDLFPLESTELPFRPDGKRYDGWLIFFDEFNSAPLSVQAASYKIVLDKAIGQHKLHKRAAMVCAGNLSSNQAIVNRLSTAMQSRLVHLELEISEANILEWVDWASKNALDHRVISYVQSRPENLHNFDPNHNDKTFACPRTWEFASKLIAGNTEPLSTYKALLCGTVSEGIAIEFIAYTDMYIHLPTFDEIRKDPKGAKLPDDPAMKYAVSHLVAAHTTIGNIKGIMPYITRLPIEFETITLQNVIHRNEEIIKEECIRDWISEKGMEIFQ